MIKRLISCNILIVSIMLYGSDTITLDLSSILSDYNQTEEGYWESTYSDESYVEYNIFRFSHKGDGDAGGGMSYWDGFTICTNGDTTDYGVKGSSDGWLAHQFGCMAGGGLNAQFHPEEGLPYLVGYWGFFYEKEDTTYHSLRVDFTDGNLYKAVGVYICNHPWPYYGNLNGDGFASVLNQEGEHFTITAHGLNADGGSNGKTVTLDLAKFNNGNLIQKKTWQYLDLQPLGNIAGLYFTMETSDEDKQFGPNTAVYFCLDKLRVCTMDTQSNLMNIKPQKNSLKVFTLFGQKVNTDNIPSKGIYIMHNGTKTKKIIRL